MNNHFTKILFLKASVPYSMLYRPYRFAYHQHVTYDAFT
jgi:hypothetical protein